LTYDRTLTTPIDLIEK